MSLIDKINNSNGNNNAKPTESLIDTINKGVQETDYLFPSQDILVDYSKYEPYLGKSTALSLSQWDDERARQQSGLTKLGRSVGLMAGTFTTALASTGAALVGGATALGAEAIDLARGEDEYKGMDIFLNNPIMQGINEFDKYLKEDLLPVYYTKEQQESIFSASTGTDLLNGIGFLASNLLPNAFIINRLGGLSKMAAASKAGKLTGLLDDAVKTGKVINTEAEALSKTARYLDKLGPVTGALVGRLGESAIESYGTYEQIKESLTAENELAQQELALYGTTDKTIRTPEEIEAEAKRGRDNVFKGNMFLAASDFLQAGRWLGGKGLADDLVKEGLKTTIRKKGKAELLGNLIAEGAQEAAEEGYQFLLSKGAEKSASGKSFLEGISEASGELFSTSEGLKSMLIGAVLGGGVSGIVNVRDAKKNKELLKNWADQLTANADIKQRFIQTPDGKMVVNPELTKIATTFAFYEQQKQQALANNDNEAYDLAEKMQFSDLVAAKVDTGTYDDFIDELKSLSTARPEEVKAMFGSLPIKDGKEMTPSQVISEKIALAERVKNLQEGLAKLPQLQNIPTAAFNVIRYNLFTQENLRDQIQELDSKITEIKSRAVTEYDAKTRQVTENKLLPFDQQELDQLTKDREVVFDQFIKVSDQFKQFVAKPEEAEKKAEKAQNDILNQVVKDTEDTVIKDEKTLQDAELTGQQFELNGYTFFIKEELPNGNYLVESIEGNEQREVPKQNLLDLLKSEPEALPEEDLEETEDIPSTEEVTEDQDKSLKLTQLSTSGRAVEMENGRDVVEQGERRLNPEFRKQTEIFNDPANTPNVSKTSQGKVPVITFKAEKVKLTDKQKKGTNNRRIESGLPALSDKDFEDNTDYTPIKLTMYINGQEQPVSNMFHNPEYYYKTAEWDRIEKDSDLSEEEKEFLHKQNLQRQKDIRKKLVETITNNGPVTLTAIDKSTGVLNFNPSIEGERKTSSVMSVFEVDSIEEFLKPKKLPLYIGKNQVKLNGLVVVKNVTEVSGESQVFYKVSIIDTNNTERDITLSYAPQIGEMLYDVVMANGTVKTLNIFNKQIFSAEQIEDITALLYHKLTQAPTIEVDGKSMAIVGKSDNPGIVDSLIYIGTVKSDDPIAIASQIVFNKQGELVLGTEKISKEDPDARNKIKRHLNNYKSTPQFKIRSLDFDSFGIPTQTAKGWTIKNPVPYADFMFGGKNPLIQTALNQIKYTDSYYSFALDNNGDLLMEYEVKKQPTPTAPVSSVEKSIRIANLEITQKVNSKGNIEREIKNVDNGKSLLNVITPEGKSMFFSLPNLNEAIDNQSQAVKDVIGNVDITKKLAALEAPVSDKKTDIEKRKQLTESIQKELDTINNSNNFEYNDKVEAAFIGIDEKQRQKLIEKLIVKKGLLITGQSVKLNAYHGTFQDIEGYLDLEKSGLELGEEDTDSYKKGVKYSKPAVFATSSKEIAETYSQNDFGKKLGKVENVVVDFKNPLVINARNTSQTTVLLVNSAIIYASENGYDGVIIKNINDSKNEDWDLGVANTYIGLQPKTIAKDDAELDALEGAKSVEEVKTKEKQIEELKEKRRKELGFDYDNIKIGESFDIKYNWADSFETLKLFAKSKDGNSWLIGKTKETAKWKKLKDFRGDTLKYTQEKIDEINARYNKQIQEIEQVKPKINKTIEQKENECKGQTKSPKPLNLDNWDLPDL